MLTRCNKKAVLSQR